MACNLQLAAEMANYRFALCLAPELHDCMTGHVQITRLQGSIVRVSFPSHFPRYDGVGGVPSFPCPGLC